MRSFTSYDNAKQEANGFSLENVRDIAFFLLKNMLDNIVKLDYNMTISKTEVIFYVRITGNNTPIC